MSVLLESKEAGKLSLDNILRGLQGYTPGERYGGQMTTDLTSQEQSSLDFLNKYSSGAGVKANDLYGLGRGRVDKDFIWCV